MQSYIMKRDIGVNFDKEGNAEIKLWAPKAAKASVVINKADELELQQQDYGYWTLRTKALREGDLYQFKIEGGDPLPDPASLAQPDGVHGLSQAVDLAKLRVNKQWNNPALESYIIYELHTGTFSHEGTFEGIEAKLDYLKDLGVNAIEIMPVAQFPGTRNWGYDGVFTYAVQQSYGGAHGLRKLVDACHEKGIAVILDVVYNHMGPEGNYLGVYGDYFTGKYHTPWGDAINFDDAWCDGVRRFVIENVLMWFRDFGIDALRMDAVHAIKDFSPKHLLRDIKEHVDQLMAESGNVHYLIAECDLNDTKYIDPIAKEGYGMDAQWIDEFHHSLRVASGNEQNGYYADFNGIAHLAKAYKDAYVYDGIYSEHRQKTFGNKAADNPGSQFIVFSQNHDQVGNRMLGERTSQLVSFEMQKLMAGAVLVSPFVPMLFMGEEWSESNPFQYFVSHTDKELIEAVRKGRKEEFKSFFAQGEAPDPQDEATFLRSKLQWQLLNEEPHKIMHQYYKELIALRKANAVLQRLDRDKLSVTADEAKQVLVLHRWHGNEHLLCLMNFSNQQQIAAAPDENGKWQKVLDSASAKWNGPKDNPEYIEPGTDINLQPESIVIYSC